MSALKDLMAQLDAEDEQRKKENEKHFEAQYKKFEEMQKKLTATKDDTKKHQDSITKGLERLVANKHTIEQGVKQTENLSGLPIPQDIHGIIIELVSSTTKFMNKIETLNNETMDLLPSEIHQDVVKVAQSISDELQSTCNEFTDTQKLYHKIAHLKELSADDSFADGTQDFNSSIF